MNAGPALVSILRQGDTLVASVHTALDDSEMVRFQNDLINRIGEHRARGVIITGLSPTIAQTLVTIGVDLSKMNTIGDLQGGLEEAERLLGYTVTRGDGAVG